MGIESAFASQEAFDRLVVPYRKPCDCKAKGEKWCTYRWPEDPKALMGDFDHFPDHFAPLWMSAVARSLLRSRGEWVTSHVLRWCAERPSVGEAAAAVYEAVLDSHDAEEADATLIDWLDAQGCRSIPV